MEQPESNPTFCTNNCGFYGSSQFEGMCSKCYRDHVSRSLNTGRPDSFNSRSTDARPEVHHAFPLSSGYYASSTSAVPSSSSASSQAEFSSTSTSDVPVQQQAMRDDEDEMIGRMDEDNLLLPPANPDNATVNKMDDDDENSESPLPIDESSSTTKPDLVSPPEESSPSLLTRVVPTSTLPMTISRSIDIPIKNDSNISLSVMETSSLGRLHRLSLSPIERSFYFRPLSSRFHVSIDSIQC